MGDPASIGPEVVLRAIGEPALRGLFDLTVVGSRVALEAWSMRLGLRFDANVVDPGIEGVVAEPGRPTDAGARAALEAVVRAAGLCRAGEVDAMVTAPVSKAAIVESGQAFTGHTEFLAQLLGVENVLMLFVQGAYRIGLATTHLPLSEVASALTEKLVTDKLALLARGLTDRFGIAEPRIAVTGLNPHAGESGRLGEEEERIIAPAIAAATRMGVDVEGPFPADSIYRGLGEPERAGPGAGFDAVLAMYHDQGTIPFKLLACGRGVNVTLGLPIVRTSVDHGTAFDRAGRGDVDAGSMIAAVRLAGEMAQRSAGRRRG
jgi:4-hydroxythreonine-4-phosphate dehydrogenase